MSQNLIAKASIEINASAKKVWQALTDPAMIKQYLFGTEVSTDWKVGSSIIYRGEWQGKPYEDKGTIVKIEPEKYLETTYWSSMTGEEDKAENYKQVIYQLEDHEGKTVLTITNDHNASEIDRDHSQQNWQMVLESLKRLLGQQ